MNARLTVDSWYNPVTGVGSVKDKTAGFTFQPYAYQAWDYPFILASLYESDELAAIAVDAVVDDAFANGWSVEAAGLLAEHNEAVIEFNDRLRIRESVTDADKWARLFGGGGVWMGSDDGPQENPLTLGGNLHFAQPFERDELYPTRWYDNPLNPKFGTPSHYRLQPHSSVGGLTAQLASKDIHESRFLLFYGAKTTKQRRVENLGWGSSVLLRPMTALKQFNGAYALVLSLLADANQNIYKLDGFAELALMGRDDAIKKRIEMIDTFRSAVNALIIDAKTEDFVRSQLSLSGIDGVVTQYKERLAAAFRMPLTRLLGVSPAGLNATGESDERNWDKQVLSHQSDVLRPALERWMRVAFAARNGPTRGVTPDSFKVKFPPLRAPTPREQAEIDSIAAQTYEKYHTMGALKVSAIAKAAFSAEQTRPVLSTEELAALELSESVGELPASGAPLLPDAVDSEDTIEADDEPDVDHDLLSFVEQMNANNVERCPHGKLNRCRICGIESVRSVTRGADGVPAFTSRWRPIGSFGVDPNAGQQGPEAQAGQTTI